MKQRGHTLLGLMLTIAIASVMMTLAAPSFSGLLDRTQLSTSAEGLFRSLWFARGRAVSHREHVVIAAVDGQWQQGWRIFVDANADGTWQPSEPVLRTRNALDSRWQLTANGGIGKAIYYRPDGQTRKPGGSLQMGRLTLCSRHAQQAIVINSVGRPRLEPRSRRVDAAAC